METRQAESYSPMMQQYREIKGQHPNQLLFFRLGDFYEMFFEDAEIASRELELTLTSRECGNKERAPMCGVPYHSCDAYIARLIEKGYQVAICEQTEDPKKAKGLVKREITRVVTPGTVLETNMLDEGRNNYIAVVYGDSLLYGCAFADISTGEVRGCQLQAEGYRIRNEIGRFAPSEILLGGTAAQDADLRAFLNERIECPVSDFDFSQVSDDRYRRLLPQQFEAETLEELSLSDKPQLCVALCGLLDYLAGTQRHGMECLRTLQLYSGDEFMNLDLTAIRNLELTRTLRSGEKKGSLLWVLDKTRTAMGKRLLRSWLEKPLLSPARIHRRLHAVGELTESAVLLGELREDLAGVFDLERLVSRIVYGTAGPREVKNLEYAASRLPALKMRLESAAAQALADIHNGIDTLDDLRELINRALVDEPPQDLKDGGVIREGFDPRLDELRGISKNARGAIAKIESGERSRTGIKNLRIGFNRVFGYYIEVTKSYLSQVPDTYIRKQTLANCERYVTQELKELEDQILNASEKITDLEQEIYGRIREQVCENMARVQKTAALLAQLDVFCSFAQVSVENAYCCPQVDLSGSMEIRGGRHPVVERTSKTQFVHNDVLMDRSENRVLIITGPNMAGKSTYMRMTALIVLMAQIGCFVPARSARISVVDGIYTRVGASDDLSTGQSTFMVEMSEVADILQSSTRDSLLILDEIGRGTSTYDGMAIARAVVEFIAQKVGAKTMFATHYHELTSMEEEFSCVKNYNIAVKRQGEEVIFLRRVVRGGADDSYGIYVAGLAGVPSPVVKRAQTILKMLEGGGAALPVKKSGDPLPEQIVIQQTDDSEIVKRLKETDVNSLTPVMAIALLDELKKLL